MQVHFSSIVTIFLASVLVSGTVGCRNTGGGPWYNPATYSFSNPFDKDSQASPYSSSMANQKPSLEAQPNISTPHGGYTDSASFAASPATSGGTVSSTPPAHWAQHSPTAQQNSPNPHGGYTVADPSQWSPQTYTESYAGHGVHAPTSAHQYSAAQSQQSPQQFHQESIQQAHSFPATPYSEQYAQTVYQTTSAYQQQSMNNVPAGAFSTVEQPVQHGSFDTMPPSDPYAGMQQPTAVPPTSFSHEQSMPTSYTYPGEGVSGTSPYQPYQPPAASGAHGF